MPPEYRINAARTVATHATVAIMALAAGVVVRNPLTNDIDTEERAAALVSPRFNTGEPSVPPDRRRSRLRPVLASETNTASRDGGVTPTSDEPENNGSSDLAFAMERQRTLATIVARVHDVQIGPTGVSIDELATSLQPWIDGWTDGFLLAADASDLYRLQSTMEHSICDPGTRDLELLVFLRLLARIGQAATQTALECAVSRRTGEDVVLWEALDTWLASRRGMEGSEAIAEWRVRAVDPRTLSRLGLVARTTEQ